MITMCSGNLFNSIEYYSILFKTIEFSSKLLNSLQFYSYWIIFYSSLIPYINEYTHVSFHSITIFQPLVLHSIWSIYVIHFNSIPFNSIHLMVQFYSILLISIQFSSIIFNYNELWVPYDYHIKLELSL